MDPPSMHVTTVLMSFFRYLSSSYCAVRTQRQNVDVVFVAVVDHTRCHSEVRGSIVQQEMWARFENQGSIARDAAVRTSLSC